MPQESFSNPKFGLLKNLKIGVLYGGASSERKISLRSGRAVHKALRKMGFSTTWIDPRNLTPAHHGLESIDLAFVALHGRGGEDGTIQERLERQGIPYIGSGVAGSRRAFDKGISKKIFEKHGIPTARWVIISRGNWKAVLTKFPGPYFIKPLREGSSIGVFAVDKIGGAEKKIVASLKQYGELLVEEKISGREFTVGVLEKKALPVVELKPKSSFYDYKAKYTKGMTRYIVPARIPVKLSRVLQHWALKVNRVLGLRDFSRVDMMVDARGKIYVLEANSIPGFTELSLLPKAAGAAGISFEELCCRLVGAAYARRKSAKKEKKIGKKETQKKL